MDKIILGVKGNLARAINNYYPNSIQVTRSEFIQWPEKPNQLEDFLSKLGIEPRNCIILNCAGITDTDADLKEIKFVNSSLPIFLAEKSVEIGFKLATFGTVMEHFPKYSKSNRYLNSKLAYFEEYTSREDWKRQNIHFQMHTLYGGSHVKPEMFLGQIFNSIVLQKSFKMTGGDQIREYHHVDDVVRAIGHFIDRGTTSTHHISQGNPLRLVDLATAIFKEFNSINLLHIAAQSADINDNRNVVFRKTEDLEGIDFRESIEGVISWLRALGVQNEANRQIKY
ncbi:NAD-dependent epimerase/dehydratase family protein [Candidatus Planktophila dulcis]|uniref:NAD-dependent epimerase/dehydratase family protein n=1 Tax=Candidatus Planktophila dulcis TaxID=1884914 RepID=UPI003CF769F6